MNTTNRMLNRSFVLLVGLLALGAGATAVALVAVPGFLGAWSRTAPELTAGLTDILARTEMADSGASWVPLAGLAGAALLVLLLVAFIARQVRGRTTRLIEAAPSGDGATIVDAAVAEQLLTDALQGHPEFVTVTVRTYRLRGTPVLRVAAGVRRGVSPRDALTVIEAAVLGLDRTLGAQIPVLVRLGGGVRLRITDRTRAQPTDPSDAQYHPLEKERTQ